VSFLQRTQDCLTPAENVSQPSA